MVDGYGGNYWVSNLGRVLSTKVNKQGKIMTGSRDKDGYLLVTLNGKSEKIHRLVAGAFLSNPENKPCVNHLDECKQNNKASNLEWATNKENSLHGTSRIRISKQKGKQITYLNKVTKEIKTRFSMTKASIEEGFPKYYFGNLLKSKSMENELFKILFIGKEALNESSEQ